MDNEFPFNVVCFGEELAQLMRKYHIQRITNKDYGISFIGFTDKTKTNLSIINVQIDMDMEG